MIRITFLIPIFTEYRDIVLGDDALLYIAYVMLIWTPLSQVLQSTSS